MPPAAILAAAAAAVIVAAVLAIFLVRARARLAELEAHARVGPMPVADAFGDDRNERVGNVSWSAVFQEMIYSANDVFWESDTDHRFRRAVYRNPGQPAPWFDELLGCTPWELPAVGVPAEAWEKLKATMNRHEAFHEFVAGRIDSHGDLLYSSMSGVAVFGVDGAFAGYRGAARDYNTIRQTQVQLEIRDAVTNVLAGTARLSDALPAILEAVCAPLGWQFGARWMRDARDNSLICGEIWSKSPAAPLIEASRGRRFPITTHDIVSRAWTTLELCSVPDIAQNVDFNRRESALASGLASAFAFPVTVQGEVVCVLEFLGPQVQRADALLERMAASLGNQLALFWLRREAEARLTYAATHDALTGLRNRLSFNTELDRAILRAKRNNWRLGLMFIDLDGFKQINDRLGHHAGDALLIEVAKRLKNSLRLSDTIARMGGDEFVVVLEHTGTDGEIAEIARKLLAAVRAPYEAFGGESLVSASFGVAIYPVDATDQQGLLTHADSAMYRAKESRENRVVFYRPPASDLPSINRRLDVSAAIEAAASSMPATDSPAH